MCQLNRVLEQRSAADAVRALAEVSAKATPAAFSEGEILSSSHGYKKIELTQRSLIFRWQDRAKPSCNIERGLSFNRIQSVSPPSSPRQRERR
jgi:hypothetical protein